MKGYEAAKAWANRAAPVIREALEKQERSAAAADRAGRKISSRLPSSSPKLTLRKAAFTACVEAGKGLTTSELAFAVKELGYKSRSSSFESYLRRVVRNDGRFVSTGGRLMDFASRARPAQPRS